METRPFLLAEVTQDVCVTVKNWLRTVDDAKLEPAHLDIKDRANHSNYVSTKQACWLLNTYKDDNKALPLPSLMTLEELIAIAKKSVYLYDTYRDRDNVGFTRAKKVAKIKPNDPNAVELIATILEVEESSLLLKATPQAALESQMCNRCKLTKLLTDFYRDKDNKKNGRRTICKTCSNTPIAKYKENSLRAELTTLKGLVESQQKVIESLFERLESVL